MFERKKDRVILERVLYVFIFVVGIAFIFSIFYFGPEIFTGFAVFTSDDQTDFDLGTYNNTAWNTDHVGLAGENVSGTYVSGVYDATSGSSWDNMSWVETVSGTNVRLFFVDGSADVWKSVDTGSNWNLIKDDYNGGNGNGATDMVIDSNGYLYIVHGQDIWQSTDNGDSWTLMNDNYNGGESNNAKTKLVDSSDNLYIIEGDEELWNSSNSGTDWSKLSIDINGGNGDTPGSAVDSNNNFYAVDNQADVWNSSDGGLSWSLSKDDYNGGVSNGASDMTVDSSDNLYIVHNQDVWQSTDFGLNWTLVNDDFNGGETQSAQVMIVDNDDNLYIFEGDEYVWMSNNSGTTWTKVATDPNGGNGNVFGAAADTFSNDLTLEVKSCDNIDCSDAEFSGSYTDPSGEILSLSDARYFQYRAIFSSEEINVSSELSGFSVDYTIVDYDAPSITLVSPADSSTSDNENVTFSYSVSSDLSISSCSLVLDGAISSTDNSITKDTTQTFSSTLSNAAYNWNINCTDGNSQVNTSEVWSLIVDYTTVYQPTVELISPVNESTSTDDDVTFSYNVTSVINVSSCDFILNGAVDSTDSSISKDTEQTFSKTSMDDGDYNWSISCTDSESNVNSSSTWIVTVDYTEPTGDDPTGGSTGGNTGGSTGGTSGTTTVTIEEDEEDGDVDTVFLNITIPEEESGNESQQAGNNLLTGFATFTDKLGEFAGNNIVRLVIFVVFFVGLLVLYFWLMKGKGKKKKIVKRKRGKKFK